jgi:hypothetical protein
VEAQKQKSALRFGDCGGHSTGAKGPSCNRSIVQNNAYLIILYSQTGMWWSTIIQKSYVIMMKHPATVEVNVYGEAVSTKEQ